MFAADILAATIVGLLLINAALAILVVLTRGWPRAAGTEALRVPTNPMRETPFVSVHLAIHDEPPALVVATLEALAAQDWPAFEVLVIDNNTPDPATWAPVAARVAALGPRFRFWAETGMRGAKAGALNLALARSDPRTVYVAIVDADYQATPDFLRRGVATALAADAQFVQFPQAYRATGGARPVEQELGDYFRRYPRAADAAGAPLLTGTMSLIARDALQAAGGWPEATITEDADLGVALWRSGQRGVYADAIVGRGLLPVDFAGLRVQRARWVAGNVQTLRGLLSARPRYGRRGLRAILAQLTAWPNFAGVPLATLAIVALAGPSLPLAGPIAALASITLAAGLILGAARMIARRQPGLLLVKSALLWTAATAWWPVLAGRRLRFARTPKLPGLGPTARVDIERIGGLVSLATAVALAARGWPLPALAALIGAGGLVTAPLVDHWLRRAARQAASA